MNLRFLVPRSLDDDSRTSRSYLEREPMILAGVGPTLFSSLSLLKRNPDTQQNMFYIAVAKGAVGSVISRVGIINRCRYSNTQTDPIVSPSGGSVTWHTLGGGNAM
jgi:hypothetical protein